MSNPTLALAESLISRRSLTPDDAGCCELIGARLAQAGFALEYLNAQGVTNLWATRGSVPPGAVVVAGSLPKDGGAYSLNCAVIVKKVDAKTRAKTSLNELLRGD